ncbi:hypothetical protein Trydic_g7116 [Trypoxylus dichotomus]
MQQFLVTVFILFQADAAACRDSIYLLQIAAGRSIAYALFARSVRKNYSKERYDIQCNDIETLEPTDLNEEMDENVQHLQEKIEYWKAQCRAQSRTSWRFDTNSKKASRISRSKCP